ncbi:unnamed protein product [Amoebophrya sp. A120]|nr:unnamed protein product [Amoebophrya sp. A120]|eukprot:GSA120T00020142001.1
MSSTRQASQTGGGAKGVSQPSTGSTSSTTLSQQARRFSLPATRVPAPILFNTQPAGSGKINLQGGATSSSSRIVTSTRVVTTGPRPTTAVSGSATVAPGSQNKVLDRGSSPMPRSLLTTGPPIHAASRSTTPRLLRFDPSTMGKFTSVSPAVSRSVSAARSPSVTGGTPTLVQHPTPRHSTTTLPEAPSSGKKSTTAAGGSANKKEPEKKPAPNSTSTTNGTINPPPKQFLQVPGGGKVLSTPQVNTKLTYYTPTVPKTILQTSSSVPAMIPGTALNLKTDFGNIPTPTIQIPAATSSHKPAQTTTSVAKQKSPASVVAPSPRGGGSTSVQVPAPSSAVKAPSAMRVPFGVIAGPKPLSTDLPNRTWDTLPLLKII